MSAIDDGGPAFPSSPTCGPNGDLYRPADIGCEGMTLRDWFAGQALAGYLADTRCTEKATPSTVAEWCYANADAMLAARNKTTIIPEKQRNRTSEIYEMSQL